MGMMDSKEQQLDHHIDLEKGPSELGSESVRMNQFCSKVVSGGFVGCNDAIKGSETANSALNSDGLLDNNVMLGSENKQVREKPKAMSAKKPPKPPRPPRGLSLDSADQKLIRELHELARLKRARIERMKALKKAKETKTVSSKSHWFATLFTVLFAFVLLVQGISSRTHSAASFQGSPISSGVTDSSGVISLQQDTVPSMSNVNGPHYESPGSLEGVSGAETVELIRSAVD